MSTVLEQLEKVELGYYSLPVADPMDARITARRETIRHSLDSQATALGRVQTRLNVLSSQQQALAAGGSSSSVVAAWKRAIGGYDELEATLKTVEKDLVDIVDRIGREEFPAD